MGTLGALYSITIRVLVIDAVLVFNSRPLILLYYYNYYFYYCTAIRLF